MKRRWIVFGVVVLALIAGAGWYIRRTLVSPDIAAPNTTAQATPESAVRMVNGETVVVVSPEAQRASHLVVTPLAPVSLQRQMRVYATVLDLQPLFNFRGRLATARSDITALTAQAGNSRAQYERSRRLFADDRNLSQKSLQEAQTAMQSDAAKLEAARAQFDELAAALRQQFGEAVTSAATAPSSVLMSRLEASEAVLLRVTLPDTYGPAAPQSVLIRLPGGGSLSAERLSASPQADPAIQGHPWLYVARRALPAGLRMEASVPLSGPATSGVLIPEQAVVWYGGETWAYLRTGPDHFTRRYVPSTDPTENGYIATGAGFRAGDAVVTQGAQLLLSEELKPQGIATACKDPPECDD